MMHITAHAIQRYKERVALVDDAHVIAALSGPTFDIAVQFGASIVKLGTGHRAVIRDDSVITVLPKATSYHGHIRGDDDE